jgi:hypothetical protein
MTREINRKFDWTKEAEDYIKEVFANEGMAAAYHGRIVVKCRVIGFDASLNTVKEYTNKFGKLYIAQGGCNAVVTSVKPQMSSEF